MRRFMSTNTGLTVAATALFLVGAMLIWANPVVAACIILLGSIVMMIFSVRVYQENRQILRRIRELQDEMRRTM